MVPREATVEIEIPFYDVDLMEVAWHGHYLKYFEIARSAFFRSIDYDYADMRNSGLSWPIVEARLRYVRPARLGQTIRVRARLTEFELRLKIEYLVTDAASGERLTKGHTVQVPVDIESRELVLGTPAIIYEKLGIAG